MAAFLRLLRSPGLALGVLLFLAVYGAGAAWGYLASPGAAGTGPPGRAFVLEHPFTSAPFLLACALLFVNTFACTWDRTRRLAALWRGTVPATGFLLEGGGPEAQEAFLRRCGFKGSGPSLFRFRWALWGGWLLHSGLLVLMVAIFVQQGFHEGGTFELAEGERLLLDRPGAVRDRHSGFLAPRHPPALEVGLLDYDPSLHRPGFSPDRCSRVFLRVPGADSFVATLDRASGVSCGGITLFQAIPTGVALTLEIEGLGTRSVHLNGEGRIARGEVTDPAGVPTVFILEAERDLSDRLGTGVLKVRVERLGTSIPLQKGKSFSFGRGSAIFLGVNRWSAFTYSRSPGMPLVFASFMVMVAASVLMVFPAGVARLETAKGAFRVYTARGGDVLLQKWAANGAPGIES